MGIINNEEILTNVATKMIEDSIKLGWDKVKDFFINLSSKDSVKYGKAYEEYLIKTFNKVSKIKTIIYRRVPKDLYSFYVCIGVSYNGQSVKTDSIMNLLSIGHKLIITGTGGIGKSILFKHLFLNTIKETQHIPILIDLKSFNFCEMSLFNAIFSSLKENGFVLSEKYFEYSMDEGAYVIFLDGFDEVNRDKTQNITEEIKSLTTKYHKNYYFISSRPSEEFIGWNDFCEIETLKLTKQQALNLIDKIDFDESVKTTFSAELNTRLFDKYESFASNPLLLNIMLLTFQKHALIPERLNDFYDEAFVTLFNVHDATKECFVRDIRTRLGCEDFKLVFSYICFKSYFHSKFQFSETELRSYIKEAKEKFDSFTFDVKDFQEDLTQSVCMLVKEGIEYRFSHRLFQEYFAAFYTCKLLDYEQSKLLLAWIKESRSVLYDSYFQMLFDMQRDKVNMIIICPILKELLELYKKMGYCFDFLNKLFRGISIKEIDGNRCISLTIRDNYLCHGLLLNNELNNFHDKINDYALDNILYSKVKEFYFNESDSFDMVIRLDFDKILEVISQEELLNTVKWVVEYLEFAQQILEKYEDKNVKRKKNVSSILDEL